MLLERYCFLGDGVLPHTSSRAIIRVDFGLMKEGGGKTGEGVRDSAGHGELADFLLKKNLSSRRDRYKLGIVLRTWAGCMKMGFRKTCEEGDWEPSRGCACRNSASLHKPVYGAQMAYMAARGWRYGSDAGGVFRALYRYDAAGLCGLSLADVS